MLAQCRKSCRVSHVIFFNFKIMGFIQEQFSARALPKIIQTYGGLEDHVVDVFGFKMPICPENGGFATDGRFVLHFLKYLQNPTTRKNQVKGLSLILFFQEVLTIRFYLLRQTILHLMALNEEQPAWVPKFTKVGFEKTKIPPELYAMLLREYERVKASMYEESCAKAVINCEQIIDSEEEEESSLRSSKRTFITQLRFDFPL